MNSKKTVIRHERQAPPQPDYAQIIEMGTRYGMIGEFILFTKSIKKKYDINFSIFLFLIQLEAAQQVFIPMLLEVMNSSTPATPPAEAPPSS